MGEPTVPTLASLSGVPLKSLDVMDGVLIV